MQHKTCPFGWNKIWAQCHVLFCKRQPMINDICVLHYFQDFAAISENFSLTVSFYFTLVSLWQSTKIAFLCLDCAGVLSRLVSPWKTRRQVAAITTQTHTHTVSQANLHLTHCSGYGYVDTVDTSTTVNHVLFWDMSYSESNEFLHACARIWILSCSATYSPR